MKRPVPADQGTAARPFADATASPASMHVDKRVYLERATWPSPDGRADTWPPGPLIDGTPSWRGE